MGSFEGCSDLTNRERWEDIGRAPYAPRDPARLRNSIEYTFRSSASQFRPSAAFLAATLLDDADATVHRVPSPRTAEPPRSKELKIGSEFLPHCGACSPEGVTDGLLCDSQLLGDLRLLQVFLVVEVDDLLLSGGQDVEIVEERVDHQASLVKARKILRIDPTLLHGGEERLDVVAHLEAGSAEGTSDTDRLTGKPLCA